MSVHAPCPAIQRRMSTPTRWRNRQPTPLCIVDEALLEPGTRAEYTAAEGQLLVKPKRSRTARSRFSKPARPPP